MIKEIKIAICLSSVIVLTTLRADAQWTLTGTGAAGKITTPNNVGIGTTNPAGQLHLVGDGLISQDSSSVGGRISLRNKLKTGAAANNWTVYNMEAPYPAGLHFWRYAANGTNLGSAMIIADNGNVGIGVGNASLPAAQLHVLGDGIITQWSTPEGGRISIRNTAKTGADINNWTIYNMTSPYIKGLHFWRYAANGTNLNASVVFGDDGTVKIGNVSTPNPAGYKLYVDQGILTEKIKVAVAGTAQWSDYVFAKDYNLMPLDEVAQFVKTNKHLPNVPSAAEMVKEGNDLGKTTAKLLEKIEELTLYMIELKKQDTRRQKEIQDLKTEILALRKQIH